MKNYFNAEERARHIVLLAMQEPMLEFSKCDALTEEEKSLLKKIHNTVLKFNKSVFERLGEPYQRKVESTMRVNNLELVGKFQPHNDCLSYSAQEDLIGKLSELRMFNCLDCEKCDFKDCAMYAMCIACDIDGEGESGCPYAL